MSMKKLMLIAALCGSGAAMAQTDSATQLQEVVVTATKTAKSIAETGKVITVISSDVLRRSMGKDLSQVLNEQAGVVVNGANTTNGKDKNVYVRGAKTGYTVVLIDGVPMSDPSGISSAFDLRLLDLNQIERIEILKGAQSTLYGPDAMAGVINIITKKASGAGSFNIRQTLAGGSFGTLQSNTNLFGKSSDAFQYNLNVGYFKTHGISEAKEPNGTNNFDADGNENFNINLNLGIQASSKVNIQPFVRYSKFDGKFDDGANTDAANTFQSTLLHAGALTQLKLGAESININLSYQQTKRDYQYSFGNFAYDGSLLQADAFWNHNFSEQVALLAGIDYRSIKNVSDQSTPKDPTANLKAVYASLFLKNVLEKGLYTELGVRYTNHSEFGGNFTWNVNPSFRISNEVKLFANFSSAFRTPTLDELYGAFGANTALKPENAFTIDAGVQYAAADQSVNFRAAFFYRNVNDAISYIVTNPTTFAGIYRNVDNQKDNGLELELTVKASEQISFNANYTYVDGQVTESRNGTDKTFYNLFLRPRNSFNIGANVQATQKLLFNLNLQSVGSRYQRTFNGEKLLQDYLLINFYAAYQHNNHFNFFVDVKNLANVQLEEVFGYNSLPANIRAGVVLNW
jgi:vitamin B12 transporter